MSEIQNNPSFVLRGVEDVIFEDRPVPERMVDDFITCSADQPI